MKAPKVSVLISVYNGTKTISRAINSLLDQTFTDFEIVVVNDGSSDETAAALGQIKDKRLIVHNQPHQGLSKALNYGLKHCQGQYIARMDADDWSHPNRLKLQAAYLDKNDSVGVIASLVEYDGNRSENLGYALHVDWINTLVSDFEIKTKRFQDSPIANPSSMFRKSLIHQFGDYTEESIPEDYEFWLRLMDKEVGFHKVETPLLKWADLPSRITRNHDNYSQDNFFKVKAAYLAKWIDSHFEETPKIYVFGAGREVRRKTQHLPMNNILIDKFIDVQPPPYSNSQTIHYKNLPMADGRSLALSYVGNREGKILIEEFLTKRGYKEGLNCWMMC